MEEDSIRSTTDNNCEEEEDKQEPQVVSVVPDQSIVPESSSAVNDDEDNQHHHQEILSTSPVEVGGSINCESLSKPGNIGESSRAEEEEGGGVLRPSESFVSAIKDKKINIRLNPVGDAPILKQKLWAVPADKEVGQIIEFVKKYLKLEKHQGLFIFVNQAFAPSLDQQLKELYECFGSDGKITLHYSTTYAWG